MGIRVAVVGGGPLGLMAAKGFKEDGFQVVLFESRAWVGGLWKYSTDSSLSTAENTVFNSSKYRTAISDFPVPENMDDFPTAPQLHEYLESYCNHFDLWPYIRVNCPVKKVRREGDQWALEIGTKEGHIHVEHFDKVAFSCGPFIKPKHPNLKDIDQFGGRTLHAINFHDPSQFKDQNVLVIGAHASAQDIVSALSKYAKKAYVSHRAGVTLLNRYSSDGSVYDRMPPFNFLIITMYLQAFVPSLFTWVMDKLLNMTSKKGFPDPPASLGSLATTKAPSVTVAPPLIASEIYEHFVSGFCEGVPEVYRIIGPKSIELKSGQVIEDVDAIVYCTGYHSTIPVDFEPQELNPYPYLGSPPDLYRNIFPLHSDVLIRNSLAFLGQGAVAWPGFAPHEMIGLAVSQIWQGNSSLPSLPEMLRWHRDYLAWREDMIGRYNAGSTFYTVFLPMTDHATWLDSTAGLGLRHHLGLLSRWMHWRAWQLWWNDRRLYNTILTGLASPAIFRLFEMGKRKAWSGAREQIYMDNQRVHRQQQERKQMMDKQIS